MLRRATPEALDRLMHAVHDNDRELDAALTDLGILPPLDLTPIREWLMAPGTGLTAGVNADGHRLVHVWLRGRTMATIRHDGRVVCVDQTAALATA